MKYLVIFAFVAIIASLGTALFFMMKNDASGQARSRNMLRALAMRVGISILLFICILLAWKLGYIHPSGIPAGQ
jgi:cytochrome bd-type quinol oxidase subunit 2